MPVEEDITVPYESTKRIDYTVVKKVPYIVSSQVAVTEYEKEAYQIEHVFEQTEWEKIPYQITIEEPYVAEFFQSYSAQILIPFEVTVTEEQTFWEIEEYLVDVEVPFITENVVTVSDIQQELFTVPTVTKTTHEHELLHGLDAFPGVETTVLDVQTFEGDEAQALIDAAKGH